MSEEFKRLVQLVKAKVPLSPRAIVSKGYLSQIQKGLNNSLLGELDSLWLLVLSRIRDKSSEEAIIRYCFQ